MEDGIKKRHVKAEKWMQPIHLHAQFEPATLRNGVLSECVPCPSLHATECQIAGGKTSSSFKLGGAMLLSAGQYGLLFVSYVMFALLVEIR